eukprot:COSAG02_NODE_40864_length_400_cov_1.501661_1_plen_42_part_10
MVWTEEDIATVHCNIQTHKNTNSLHVHSNSLTTLKHNLGTAE